MHHILLQHMHCHMTKSMVFNISSFFLSFQVINILSEATFGTEKKIGKNYIKVYWAKHVEPAFDSPCSHASCGLMMNTPPSVTPQTYPFPGTRWKGWRRSSRPGDSFVASHGVCRCHRGRLPPVHYDRLSCNSSHTFSAASSLCFGSCTASATWGNARRQQCSFTCWSIELRLYGGFSIKLTVFSIDEYTNFTWFFFLVGLIFFF